jgi:adenylate kinase
MIVKTKKLLIMGPPGAGKGTQAANIVSKYGVCHISTGDMFRSAIKNGTEMGRLAQRYMENGELVPDSVTVGIVKERLAQADCNEKGFLLDGFPRNLDQAHSLDTILEELGYNLDAVINVSVENEILINRIIGRRICRSCGATYHIEFNKPKNEGVCDVCGGELYIRKDDNVDALKVRLDAYHNQTQPLIDFYAERGLIATVNGDTSLENVFKAITDIIEGDK